MVVNTLSEIIARKLQYFEYLMLDYTINPNTVEQLRQKDILFQSVLTLYSLKGANLLTRIALEDIVIVIEMIVAPTDHHQFPRNRKKVDLNLRLTDLLLFGC